MFKSIFFRFPAIRRVSNVTMSAVLIHKAVNSFMQSFVFPFDCKSVECYNYATLDGYYAYGIFDINGNITFFSNLGGNHEVGSININDEHAIFLELQRSDFDDSLSVLLSRFLKFQIDRLNG